MSKEYKSDESDFGECVKRICCPPLEEWKNDFNLRIATMKMASNKGVIDLREYKR